MKYLFLLAMVFGCKEHRAQQVLEFKNQLNLVPEGIAIHPVSGTIYVSSIAQKKIVQITQGAVAADFTVANQDDFGEGLGMKVDAKRGLLWALSNTRQGNQFTSHIHAFDLVSGKTMHHFKIADTIPRLLNDLVIHQSGSLLITDTYYSVVYQFEPAGNILTELINDTSKLKWPNGIELIDENNLVIATYGNGLVRVGIQSKTVEPLVGYRDSSIAFGLDGLVLSGNCLYGVYNAGKDGTPSNAIIKYTLDDKWQHIISEEIIDKGNAAFADPTTAAKYGSKLYVIANSHLDIFNKNKESIKGIEQALTPLKLLVYGL